MGYAHGCCCCGGCNGWIQPDGEAADGFTACDDCYYGDCGAADHYKCDPSFEGDLSDHCCGPAAPESVSFTANTKWAWSWQRAIQTLCPCSQSTPVENAPCNTVIAGGGSWSCTGLGAGSNPHTVGIWGGTGTGQGAWWIDGGAIDMTLELDQQLATDLTYAQGGALDNHPPGCCAKYYYGKCDVRGPTAPSYTQNPWGYDAAYFTGDPAVAWVEAVPAPSNLEAFGRLSIVTGGTPGSADPSHPPPQLVMQANLQIIVALKGVAEHFTDIFTTAGISTFYSQPLVLTTYSSAVVGGCSCGNGIDLVGDLDWNNPTAGSWAYAWPYDVVSQTAGTWTYSATALSAGCDGTPDYNCGGDRCTEETFTIKGYEGAASDTLGACNGRRWFWDYDDGANANRKMDATRVWSFPQTSGSSVGGMPSPLTADWAESMMYGAGVGDGSHEGTSWACISAGQTNSCHPTGSSGSANTSEIIGGFWGGRQGVGVENMDVPRPGLTDVVIGVGSGSLTQ
jgi:hypothetical protein